MNQDVFLTLVLGTLLHFRSPREKNAGFSFIQPNTEILSQADCRKRRRKQQANGKEETAKTALQC